MKLVFDSEDAILGIVFGFALIAVSEQWFKLAFVKTAMMILIPIFVIVIVLDLFHEVANLGRHFLFVGASILHNVFDLLLCVALFAMGIGFGLPGLELVAPYLADKTILLWLGVFTVASNLVWLALMPFNS